VSPTRSDPAARACRTGVARPRAPPLTSPHRSIAAAAARSPSGQRAPQSSGFEPLAIEARVAPPRARIHADKTLGWMRRLAPILLAQRWLIAGSLATLLTLTAVGTALPYVVKLAMDVAEGRTVTAPAVLAPALAASRGLAGTLVRGLGLPSALADTVAPYAVLLLGLALVQLALGYVSAMLTARTTQGIDYHLRANIYEHLSRLSFGFYDRAPSGQLISRANADIRAIEMFLAFVPRLGSSGLGFVLALTIMWLESPAMTVAALLPIPLVYVVGLAMRSRLFPISWVIQARTADVATIVEESVSGVRIVKSFVAEPTLVARLSRAAGRLRYANVLQGDIRAQFAPFLQNLPRVSRALVLGVGGWLAIQGQVTVGTIVAFTLYIIRLQAPFQLVGALMVMAQRAAASALRVFEVLDEMPDIESAPAAVDLTDARGEVELSHVSFGYPQRGPLLQDLSLRIRPGETVAIVGRTGSGKSTIARLLPRFYDASSGAVLIDGRDVRTYTLPSLRAHIGMVLDDPFLFSATVRENITYGRPDAAEDDVVAAATAAGAHEFIVKLERGYDAVIGERGYTLSGGQRQRLAIARTLLVNPKILILDDATSSIDVHLEHQIHEALRTLMKGRTTLIIAHRLSTIRLAERVLVLASGRIVADGTHEDLLAESKEYSEILAQAEHPRDAAMPPAENAPPARRLRTTSARPERLGMGVAPDFGGLE
jgi:ATP-binding cassette subfamily B protein